MENMYWMYLSLWKEHGGAPGLGIFSVNAETGELSFCEKPDDRHSFGCSYVDEKRKVLYVCNEEEKVWGVPYETGRIYGYKISPEDGKLTELFHKDTYCPNPAYIGVDNTGKFMVIAHHSITGSIAIPEKGPDGKTTIKLVSRVAMLELFSINEDGTLGELLDVKTHEVDANSRLRGSFLHCAVMAPSGDKLTVCDKGDGYVYLYAIDKEHGELKLLSRTMTDVPGARPRYCVFHPTKPYFVVNHEQMQDDRMMVSSFRYTEEGKVEKISSVDVFPEDCIAPPGNHYEQQGLCISEDGSHVYTCLNGPNTICVLSLDEDSGELSVAQQVPVTGEWPRGLAMMPGGKILMTSCLVSGDIASYSVKEDGRLEPTGFTANLKGGAYMSFSQKEF